MSIQPLTFGMLYKGKAKQADKTIPPVRPKANDGFGTKEEWLDPSRRDFLRVSLKYSIGALGVHAFWHVLGHNEKRALWGYWKYSPQKDFDKQLKDLSNELIKKNHLHRNGHNPKLIDWPMFAEMVEEIADIAPDDEYFRQALWRLFGTLDSQENKNSLLQQYLDPINPGLKFQYLNIDNHGILIYAGEQMHHFLGIVTGDMGESLHLPIPSYLLTNKGGMIHERYQQVKNAVLLGKRVRFNEGDYNMFKDTHVQKARRKFLEGYPGTGRFAVVDGIKALLATSPD